jgi:UDP-N-acetylglucosamine:LPS N-acetylglucosamine transferase
MHTNQMNSLVLCTALLTVTLICTARVLPTHGKNILLVCSGKAGHITPMFELAKALLVHHRVTLITEQYATYYVDFESVPALNVIFTNDTENAKVYERQRERSFYDNMGTMEFIDYMKQDYENAAAETKLFIHKFIPLIEKEKFDLIVNDLSAFSTNIFTAANNYTCAILSPTVNSVFDTNLPSINSALKLSEMTSFTTRLYSLGLTLRFFSVIIPYAMNMIADLTGAFPPKYASSFTLETLGLPEQKCLRIFTITRGFQRPYVIEPNTRYVGPFIKEPTDASNSEIGKWVLSHKDLIFGAFGSSSKINHDRMMSLVKGIVSVLAERQDLSLLLALGGTNYETFTTVVEELGENVKKVFRDNNPNVRVTNHFVPQKWILQQDNIKVFISHCGMNSVQESLYNGIPILGVPFQMDQFQVAARIEELGIGFSLIEDLPRSFSDLLYGARNHRYRFSADYVYDKLKRLVTEESFAENARLMASEISISGGLEQAVKELEHLIQIKTIDGMFPFAQQLPFYQRYLLDILALPLVILIGIGYLCIKCLKCVCKIGKKQKKE